jgi:hypothetical protein
MPTACNRCKAEVIGRQHNVTGKQVFLEIINALTHLKNIWYQNSQFRVWYYLSLLLPNLTLRFHAFTSRCSTSHLLHLASNSARCGFALSLLACCLYVGFCQPSRYPIPFWREPDLQISNLLVRGQTLFEEI